MPPNTFYVAAGASTFVFLAAVALKLCRNTPEAIEYRRRYEAREITKEEYANGLSLEKHRIVNISWVSPIRPVRFS